MVPGIGPLRAMKIFDKFKNMKDFLEAEEKDFLDIPDIGAKIREIVFKYRKRIYPQEEILQAKRQGIKIVTIIDDDYPWLLKQIYDPPPVLYVLGNSSVLNYNSIAIVGTRKASNYGRKAAFDFGKELATMNINVVSGMARGIDSYAHKGAITSGGPTTAVLGCGLDIVYPPENAKLMENIAEHGCVISSFPLSKKPLPGNFPARNRIISGLSLGTLVIEAAARSGSLITADFSLEQGREVFALPGSITNPYSHGTNKLIKQGAKLVETTDDIFDELCIETEHKTHTEKAQPHINDDEQDILQLIDYNPTHLEEVIQHSRKTSQEINTLITRLEIKGLITRLPGGYLVRV